MSTVQSSGLPLLSFALPIRNGEKLLPELIDSLLAQLVSAKFSQKKLRQNLCKPCYESVSEIVRLEPLSGLEP